MKSKLFTLFALVALAISAYATQGALPGKFSVSATKKIYFSQGNLQYTTSGSHACADGTTKAGTWRFAANQYDLIGANNYKASSTYTGWIDLFGWATSGYHDSNDEYNTNYQPYCTRQKTTDTTPSANNLNPSGYGPSKGQSVQDLTGTKANYDWGVYNAISNGGNKPKLWRTLTGAEWQYMFKTRADADKKWFRATVNGKAGIIALPDVWNNTSLSYNTSATNYTTNTYTIAQWENFEQLGAVFFPAAGSRSGTSVSRVGSTCQYTSSSASSYQYSLYWYNNGSAYRMVTYGERYVAASVRLVQDVGSFFTLTVQSASISYGTVSGGGIYAKGTSVSIKATPNTCYKFSRWSDGNTSNPRTVTVTGDATYTAIFEKIKYTIRTETDDVTQGNATVSK